MEAVTLLVPPQATAPPDVGRVPQRQRCQWWRCPERGDAFLFRGERWCLCGAHRAKAFMGRVPEAELVAAAQP